MKKLKCILLVDDDRATNFLNEELINDLAVVEEVHVAWNGKEALDYLNKEGKFRTDDEQAFPKPDLIFLDINMPLMDGYEFIAQYVQLTAEKRAEILIIFLTTSGAVRDKIKAMANDMVYELLEKPLRKADLLRLVDQSLKLKSV